MNKYFFLGAGLALVVAFTASSVFAQSLAIPLQGGLMPCGSLGSKMTTPAECDAADAAAGISHTQTPPNTPCAAGQIPTNEKPCMPQFGQQQMGQQLQPVSSDKAVSERDSLEQALATGRLKAGQTVGCYSAGGQTVLVENCLQAAKDVIAGKFSTSTQPNLQFNQQQFGFQQQQNQNFQQSGQQLQSGGPPIDSSTINTAITDRDKIKNDLASGRLQMGQGMNDCMLLGNKYQMSVRDCLQSLDEIIAGKIPSMLSNQQFNQQPLFGQQQFSQEQEGQSNVNLVKPTSKMSTSLKRKGVALANKLSSTLNKKFRAAKTENRRLAAVKSVARQASKVWKYVESAYGEIDEDIFDFDSSMADIADALKSRDPDLAYELTQDVLESIKQILEQ